MANVTIMLRGFLVHGHIPDEVWSGNEARTFKYSLLVDLLCKTEAESVFSPPPRKTPNSFAFLRSVTK